MDGYAVRRDDVLDLPVADDIPVGRTDLGELKPGTAQRIMTGAPMPGGAPTPWCPVERTEARYRGGTDRAHPRPAPSASASGYKQVWGPAYREETNYLR
jgi:molybdopterin biosynthesis enzyme